MTTHFEGLLAVDEIEAIAQDGGTLVSDLSEVLLFHADYPYTGGTTMSATLAGRTLTFSGPVSGTAFVTFKGRK